MMTKRYRAMLSLLVLIFVAAVLLGIPVAFVGPLSDVNPGEQAAAFFYGMGMILSGIVGLIGSAKALSKQSLRLPLLCAVGAVVSFLLVLVFGP